MVLAGWLIWRWLDPLPTRRLVIAGGPERGAYEQFARRYLPLLKAQGVAVEIRRTQARPRTSALLRHGGDGVEAAFVQGGVDSAPVGPDGERDDSLLSLGSVAYEPLWVFYREETAPGAFRPASHRPTWPRLRGWRINIGPPGSGHWPLFRQLAEANRLDMSGARWASRPRCWAWWTWWKGAPTRWLWVSAAEAPLVQYLLRTPASGCSIRPRRGLRAPLRLPARAHAAARRDRPLADDQPAHDVQLVATTASLVVRGDLHPALQQLLLQAAREAHGGAGWFARPGEFPNPSTAEVAAGARRRALLPQWRAPGCSATCRSGWRTSSTACGSCCCRSVKRCCRCRAVLPPLVEHRLRSRVFRWYAHLRRLEQALDQPTPTSSGCATNSTASNARPSTSACRSATPTGCTTCAATSGLVRRRLRARSAEGRRPAEPFRRAAGPASAKPRCRAARCCQCRARHARWSASARAAARRSVVMRRSRPSKRSFFASPGQSASTRPPAMAPPSTKAAPPLPWSVPWVPLTATSASELGGDQHRGAAPGAASLQAFAQRGQHGVERAQVVRRNAPLGAAWLAMRVPARQVEHRHRAAALQELAAQPASSTAAARCRRAHGAAHRAVGVQHAGAFQRLRERAVAGERNALQARARVGRRFGQRQKAPRCRLARAAQHQRHRGFQRDRARAASALLIGAVWPAGAGVRAVSCRRFEHLLGVEVRTLPVGDAGGMGDEQFAAPVHACSRAAAGAVQRARKQARRRTAPVGRAALPAKAGRRH